MKTLKLKIEKIEADPDVQPRAAGLHKPTVEEYAERIKAGDEFPPLVVYFDGSVRWLSEGFHRLSAYEKVGDTEVMVEQRDGSRDDAILNALGSNCAHGLKRTNADKRAAVVKALALRPSWSDRRIADLCGVSHTFASELRGGLSAGSTRTDSLGRQQSATKNGVATVATSPGTKSHEKTSDSPSGENDGEFAAERNGKHEPAVVPPTLTDAWGIPIQEHAAEAFAAVPKFKELAAAIAAAQRLFNEVANLPGGKFLTLPDVSSYRRGKKGDDGEHADRFVHEGLETALRQVKAAVPTHTVCPWNYAEAKHPKDCPTCRGLNWTPVLGNNIPKAVEERAKEAFA